MFRLTLSEIETLRDEAFRSGDRATLALCYVALRQTLTPHQEAALLDQHYGIARLSDPEARAEEARGQLRRIWMCSVRA